MTPHIKAKKGEIAKVVLMPGDPLRAEFIANTYLEDVKKVSSVRNMFMFTGKYNGREISICGSGMGAPSIGIYSFELFKFYDVDVIVRIGSSGSYKKDLGLYEVVLATEAYADSTAFAELVLGEKVNVLKPSSDLNSQIEKIAQDKEIKIHKGRIHTSDVFYSSRSLEETVEKTQAICVEMEAYALFANAKKLNKKAATLVTISDNLVTKEETTSEERQTAFTKMMEIALELAK